MSVNGSPLVGHAAMRANNDTWELIRERGAHRLGEDALLHAVKKELEQEAVLLAAKAANRVVGNVTDPLKAIVPPAVGMVLVEEDLEDALERAVHFRKLPHEIIICADVSRRSLSRSEPLESLDE